VNNNELMDSVMNQLQRDKKDESNVYCWYNTLLGQWLVWMR
jgi:hypothetical protein